MRTCQPGKTEAEDELADSKEDSPTADRTARLQEEQNLIHSMYLSMHHETLTASCDVDVLLEGFTFNCHKRILLSRSDFFAHKFSLPYGGTCRQKVKIPDIKPDIFIILLRYIYIGKIFPVSLNNLFELVTAARALSVNEVTRRCSEILSERKFFANLVQEWRYITLSRSRSSINIQELFDNSYFLTSSRSVTLFYVCENKHLQVKQETDVCDLIVAWLSKHPQLNDDESKVLGAVLQCIRWSSVPAKYVRSNLLHNENIIRSSGVEFIEKLLKLYYPSGIHVEMQRTFIRPSLGHEKVFMSIEKDKHDNYNVCMKRNPGARLSILLGSAERIHYRATRQHVVRSLPQVHEGK